MSVYPAICQPNATIQDEVLQQILNRLQLDLVQTYYLSKINALLYQLMTG